MRLFVVLGGLLVGGTAFAEPELTEAEAVQRGLERPEVRQWLSARREMAAGEAAAAGRWANPRIEYSREGADLPGGRSEDRFYWVRQRLNLAGVHGLERDAAVNRRAAENARVDYERREMRARIRRLYYEAVAARARAAAVARWQKRLDELVTMVAQRVAAGDASRFDRLRLEKELALVSGEALDARAAAESARDRLFSLIGGEPVPLAGSLLPPSVESGWLADVLKGHPLLQALSAEARGARLSSEAADRKAWPEVTLGVGRREVVEPGVRADGGAVSVGIEVPIFDRGDGESVAASARARRLAAERELAVSRIAADARSTRRALSARREAAQALKRANADGKESLTTIAESAYAEGELSVLELIDAHRTELNARRAAIDRALGARRAYIQLQLMRGKP